MNRRQAKKIMKKPATVTNRQLSRALCVLHGGVARDKILGILNKINGVFQGWEIPQAVIDMKFRPENPIKNDGSKFGNPKFGA